jgi:hypothetical protein
MPHTRTTSLCARVCNLCSFLAKAHICTLAIERHSVLQTRNVTRESPRTYRISMGTILFLETIVHFYSYEHYKVLHTGRHHDGVDSKIPMMMISLTMPNLY